MLALNLSAQKTLTVIITNIESNDGNIMIAVLNDAEKGFMTEDFYTYRIVKAQKGSVTVKFDLPVGTYGVSVFHDENNNKELDANFMHIPKEPYGFSNNVRMPNFEKGSFYLKDNQSISVKIDKF